MPCLIIPWESSSSSSGGSGGGKNNKVYTNTVHIDLFPCHFIFFIHTTFKHCMWPLTVPLPVGATFILGTFNLQLEMGIWQQTLGEYKPNIVITDTYLDSCWMELSCSNFVRCSPSTRLTISLITVIRALNWFNVSPFSILNGIRNGRILVAISSFVIPSFLCVNANL